MKKSFCTVIGSWALMCLLSVSCKKSSPAATNPITPLQSLVNSDTSMSYFHRLLLTGNESGLLADDSVTLLIPTNEAFRVAGYEIDSIGSTDAARLASYHVLKGRVLLSTTEYRSYSTMLGYNIFGMKDGTASWFNGSTLTGDTVQAGKALVYRISYPLSPAADSIGSLLTADSTLTIFQEAFNRSGLDTALLATGSYTILAPTNDAFIAAGYASTDAVDSADSVAIVGLVKNQILGGTYFTNTFTGLSHVNTLQGNAISVTFSGTNLAFSGGGNSVPANLLNGNFPAGNNYVVHRIDQVLR